MISQHYVKQTQVTFGENRTALQISVTLIMLEMPKGFQSQETCV